MKIKFFLTKAKSGKFWTDKLFGNRGNSETRGKCIIASEGMDAPGQSYEFGP